MRDFSATAARSDGVVRACGRRQAALSAVMVCLAAWLGAAVAETGYKGEVWCYELWSCLWPNIGVDISSVVDIKREAINCYVEGLRKLGRPVPRRRADVEVVRIRAA